LVSVSVIVADSDDRAEIAVRSGDVLAGTPETVRNLLQTVLDETGAGELASPLRRSA
jgi:alkanesulfonate monooxygenase SsuD/methylene tetrahydromethanopterin reductase-like flavin-dependent oxidoreductase (luciferase family)